MMYGILRTKKLKSLNAVRRSSNHTFREQATPNADPTRLRKNRTVGAKSTCQLLDALKSKLPEKRRSDAVICIEYLITASPEVFKRHGGHLDDLGEGYFSDSLAWLRKRHGEANVLSATVHLDESTPHMVAYVVPRTQDGRLSCRDFLGSPAKLREMQDDFHLVCGSKRGFKRGLKGSKAKHEAVASFYTALTEFDLAPKLCRKDYAAAAFGMKTEAWKQAEVIAQANNLLAKREVRRRKADRSRQKKLEAMRLDIVEKQQAAKHREIEDAMKTADLERRSESLAEREQEISQIESHVLSIEAERDALVRRFEILELSTGEKRKAPQGGRELVNERGLS
ncbi:MobV family relaxase [Pseudomonas juntendi]|uniref:MobV family relaxase n=1 Tax=Pseudomonas juntendi TaxID=2666183 RepID=UPI003B95B8F8